MQRMPAIFHEHDLSLERYIRYIKLFLCILTLFSFYSSLDVNRKAIANHDAIASVQSSSVFKVAQNAIENFYSSVQNEISLVRFIIDSGTVVDPSNKSLEPLFKYGEFISLDEGSKTTHEVGPVEIGILKDTPNELVSIRNIALNSTLCVKHTNLDNLTGEVRRMVYYLPVMALYHKLKSALSEIEGKQAFSIVDKNYNEIYHPSTRSLSTGLKECRSIYSSIDNEFYFCQSDLNQASCREAVGRVLNILLPLFIALGVFFFLKKLEIVLANGRVEGRPEQEIGNPLLSKQTLTSSSNFISCITHELRTPLNVIIAFSEMIKDECLGNITNKKYVCYGKEIHRFGTSLLKTVDNIIDITKSNNMLMLPQKEHVSIKQILEEAVKHCKTPAAEKEISLCKNIDSDLPQIFLDGKQVKKAVVNILNNAIKFSQNGATVSVKAYYSVHKKSISVLIEDSGAGMTIVDGIPKLENSLTRKAGGLGIGLLLSRNILRLNNASLKILSQMGKGTSSIITFHQDEISDAGI